MTIPLSPWRPIAEAPKDEERRILGFMRDADGDRIDVIEYVGGPVDGWKHAIGHWPVNPTHWMPLPEPPK